MPYIDNLPEAPPGTAYTRRFDFDADGNMIYEGWARAEMDAGTDQPFWAIRKNTFSGSNMVLSQWADGDTRENNVWDDRATLNYK